MTYIQTAIVCLREEATVAYGKIRWNFIIYTTLIRYKKRELYLTFRCNYDMIILNRGEMLCI